MNQKSRHRIATALLLALLFGCGGGGGGDDSLLAGVWNGSVGIVERGCLETSENEFYYSFTHLVNQSGENVVLDNGARTFVGQSMSENSFKVESTIPSAIKPGCLETLQWRYEEIEENHVPFVVRTLSISCPNLGSGASCRTTWSGSAFQSGRPIGVPYPLYEDSSGIAPGGLGIAGQTFEPGVEVLGDPSMM